MTERARSIFQELTVLYVEDEESIRNIVDELFLKNFKSVYRAGNGKKGLALFKEFHPDLVITDINMPIMDGLEMSRKILELDSRTPIIFTTSFDDRFFQSMDLQASIFFFKPLDLSRLMNSVEEIGLQILQDKARKLSEQKAIG